MGGDQVEPVQGGLPQALSQLAEVGVLGGLLGVSGQPGSQLQPLTVLQ